MVATYQTRTSIAYAIMSKCEVGQECRISLVSNITALKESTCDGAKVLAQSKEYQGNSTVGDKSKGVHERRATTLLPT